MEQPPPGEPRSPAVGPAPQGAARKRKRIILFIIGAAGCLLGLPACIGIIAAIAIPAFVSYHKRAMTTEPRHHVQAMSTLVMGYCEGEGKLPGAAGPVPPSSGPDPVVGDFASDPTFSMIGFAPPGPVRFSYSLEWQDAALYARARGDLDGDGTLSLFEVRCTESPCQCESAPRVVDELE